MKKIIRDLKKYFNYCVVSAKANLVAEVAGSYLNWVWWILEPFCMMLVYGFVFGQVFGIKMENYSLFLFIGISFFDFFNRGIKGSVGIIKKNKQIISKVYMPKYILVLSDMFVSLFKMLMCLVVVFIMMIVNGVPITWRALYLIPLIIDYFVFTFALALFFEHFGVFVEDLKKIVNIVLRFLFYFSGIVYNVMEKFPAPYNELVLTYYPVSRIIYDARQVLLYNQDISLLYMLILLVISCAVSFLGMQLIYHNENGYVKMI